MQSLPDSPVWFITGCSTGIGRALAEALIARGASVAVTARRVDDIAGLVGRGPSRAIALDIAEPASIRPAVDKAIAEFGRIDVLVNNAGIGLFGAIEECAPAEVEQVFRTNLFGTLDLVRAVLPQMRRQRCGRILTVTSIGGLRSRPATGIYSASKFALEGAHEALRQEVAPLGIGVTLLEPGAVRTDFLGRSMARAAGRIADYAAITDPIRAAIDAGPPAGACSPASVAAAIVALVEDKRPPPMRLALGAEAVGQVKVKAASLLAEVEAWEALSMTAASQ